MTEQSSSARLPALVSPAVLAAESSAASSAPCVPRSVVVWPTLPSAQEDQEEDPPAPVTQGTPWQDQDATN